jgi:hypothetical protein
VSNDQSTTGASPSFAAGLASFVKSLDAKAMRPRVVQLNIDGITYTSTKLSARVGWELLPRLGTLLGSALPYIMGDASGQDFDVAVIEAVSSRAMADGLMPLTSDLLAEIQCNKLNGIDDQIGSVLPDFETHFAGEYVHLLKV